MAQVEAVGPVAGNPDLVFELARLRLGLLLLIAISLGLFALLTDDRDYWVMGIVFAALGVAVAATGFPVR